MKSIILFKKKFYKGRSFIFMKSLSYEQYNSVKINQRMIKNKLKEESDICSIYLGT